MRISENRKLAYAVLVLCVVISIFALGGSAMVRARSQALDVFEAGTDPSLSIRHSMDAYLDSAADAAKLMVSEAELYQGASDLSNSISDLADQVRGNEDMDARYDAYSQLKTEVDRLYNAMYNPQDNSGFANFKLAYDDFWGYDNMIRYDEYHAMARAYNALTEGFPGKMVAALLGQEKLNAFGG